MKKETEEEFNNFMHKVTEINTIVKKLSSEDKALNQMGIADADRFLKTSDIEQIEENDIKIKITGNKTIINKVKEETTDPNTMSQEAFMKQVERDANKRYQNKLVKKEKSDTLKVQANKAFRRGEYEKALVLYNKAIDYIRDSCLLYTNRALTYIQLELYEKAISDCETALKLNEDSLKAWLYKTKCYYMLKDEKKCDECIKEVLERNPNEKFRILEFVGSYKNI